VARNSTGPVANGSLPGLAGGPGEDAPTSASKGTPTPPTSSAVLGCLPASPAKRSLTGPTKDPPTSPAEGTSTDPTNGIPPGPTRGSPTDHTEDTASSSTVAPLPISDGGAFRPGPMQLTL
jgi:hypothetical protein